MPIPEKIGDGCAVAFLDPSRSCGRKKGILSESTRVAKSDKIQDRTKRKRASWRALLLQHGALTGGKLAFSARAKAPLSHDESGHPIEFTTSIPE